MTAERFDLVVVGAGPAGAAAALHFKRRRPDARVLLLDKAAFPRAKVCGDAVSAEGVDELELLGARDAVRGYAPVTAMRVRSVSGCEVTGAPPGAAFVVPREVLDARLVAHAVAAGVELRRRRVRELAPSGAGVLVDGSLAAVVVGADGANSVTRRLAGVAAAPAAHTAIALRGYATAAHRTGELYLAWTAAGLTYAWSFPAGGDRVNAGFILPLARLHGGKAALRAELRRHLPDLDCDPATLKAHHLPLSSARPVPYQGRVLLVGDAASLVNPLTGEGIYYGLASGRLAAEAALTAPDRPGPRYAELLRAELGRHFRHTALLGRLAAWPRSTDLLVAAASDPAVLHDAGAIAFGKGVVTTGLATRIAAGWLRQRLGRA
ncbi:MAG TPA: NAD(P)/FAD-dependent oxidoreductase [Actinomycetes bacterium]|jgi:geranylgeranyl reductase family protein|nr:NAD(P)/FAD-dependent oxidoreductase [Actinomycetes bacterium]